MHAEQEIRVMLTQLLVHERGRERLGSLGAELLNYLRRQVLPQKPSGEFRFAQRLLEESVVYVGELWDARAAAETCLNSPNRCPINTCE